MFGHKAKPNLNVADVTVIQGEEGEANTCPRYIQIHTYENIINSYSHLPTYLHTGWPIGIGSTSRGSQVVITFT